MSVAALVGFLVFITWQFSNVYSCRPDNASCLFDFECCRGGCSLSLTGGGSLFACDAANTTAGSTHTQDSTAEHSTSSTMIPSAPPPSTTHRLTSPTSYTTQSIGVFLTNPTLCTTQSNDYSTMPPIETTPPTPSTLSTTEKNDDYDDYYDYSIFYDFL
uniref:WAP domain-containing protein n=1 Tax=Cuerna arida TaxID=1464854 RepID=A0A1B6GUU9_9HEMI